LKALPVSAGEGEPDYGADGVGERVGFVFGDRAQWFVQEFGVLGEKGKGDGLGGQVCADLEQGDGGRAGGAEPFQGDRPGCVDAALVVQYVPGSE
jgi:hypothetical protein